MDGKQLKNSILQWAIQGKLVPQNPKDEPAQKLLERIAVSRNAGDSRHSERSEESSKGSKKTSLRGAKATKQSKALSSRIYRENGVWYEQVGTATPKDISDEIPFEIPENWAWCRLGDLGLYRKGPFGSSLTKSMFVPKSDKAIKVYEQKNAIKKDYTLGDYYISLEKFNTMQSFIVRPNDIIVSCAGTIGETYMLPQSAPVGVINQALMRVCLYDLEIADYWQLFFEYILLKKAEMKGAGSAIKNIPPFEVLKSLLIALPPIQEQKRLLGKYREVLKHVEEFDEAQDQLDKLNKELPEALKKSILQEAIQGKLVPHLKSDGQADEFLKKIAKVKESLINVGKIKKEKTSAPISDEEKPFDLPNGWSWIRLGDCCERVTDQVASGSFATLRENVKSLKTPNYAIMVKTADFSNNFSRNLTYTDKHGYEFLSNSNLFGGELILSNIGSIGKVFIVPQMDTPMTLAPNSVMLRLLDENCRDYLYYFLLSPFGYAELMNITSGTAMKKFNKTDLKTIVIPVPPLPEQKRIVKKIEELYKVIDSWH